LRLPVGFRPQAGGYRAIVNEATLCLDTWPAPDSHVRRVARGLGWQRSHT